MVHCYVVVVIGCPPFEVSQESWLFGASNCTSICIFLFLVIVVFHIMRECHVLSDAEICLN